MKKQQKCVTLSSLCLFSGSVLSADCEFKNQEKQDTGSPGRLKLVQFDLGEGLFCTFVFVFPGQMSAWGTTLSCSHGSTTLYHCLFLFILFNFYFNVRCCSVLLDTHFICVCVCVLQSHLCTLVHNTHTFSTQESHTPPFLYLCDIDEYWL